MLIACGQISAAATELMENEAHCEECTDSAEPTCSHDCCHGEIRASVVVFAADKIFLHPTVTQVLFLSDDSFPDPVVREIDHPPQLS
jgi:hypothetical protein